MLKDLYFRTLDNDVVFSADIAKAYYLRSGIKVDPNDFDKIRIIAASMAGIERELKHPSPAMLVKHGHLVSATKVYRDIHDCSLREAKDAIDRLEKYLKED